ncbi:MAG: hypothetical protein JST31_04190 [Actinobacteria bacterium]|nr:hypothetical protein [Actinomycetota bacterium]
MYGPDAVPLRDRAATTSAGWLRGGVAGNARLTGGFAAALLILLAAEGATIPFIGRLLGPHIFIGMLLIPPVLVKMASTGYRFARYYGGDAGYLQKGPPALPLRLLAPGVVLTTVALFGTGVALAFASPPSDTLVFAHKLSFIAWFALMTVHVLGHLLEVPPVIGADWRRRRGGAAAAGWGQRTTLLVGSIVAGVGLGLIGLSVAAPWL